MFLEKEEKTSEGNVDAINRLKIHPVYHGPFPFIPFQIVFCVYTKAFQSFVAHLPDPFLDKSAWFDFCLSLYILLSPMPTLTVCEKIGIKQESQLMILSFNTCALWYLIKQAAESALY